MKNLIFLPILFFCAFAKAQCPATNCYDSLPSNVSVLNLTVNAGYTQPVWRIAAGPGVISGSTITGLKPGTTTVLLLQANNGSMSTISSRVITVAPIPVPPRKVVSYTLTNNNGTYSTTYTFDDGSTQ